MRCIEHRHLLDEETVEKIAEQGVWWSVQPFLDDEDAVPVVGSAATAGFASTRERAPRLR